MNKQVMLSALSITAAMAAPIASFPQPALARSTNIEREFAKEFRLQSAVPARYKNDEGTQILGKIYLELDQTSHKPDWPNLLKGEMLGYLYFESDEAVEKAYNGEFYKTRFGFSGEEGNVLLDQVHSQKEQGFNIYQVYGCSTTNESCAADLITVEFTGNSVFMKAQLPENLEVLVDDYDWVDGKSVLVKKWKRYGQFNLNEVPFEKD